MTHINIWVIDELASRCQGDIFFLPVFGNTFASLLIKIALPKTKRLLSHNRFLML